MERKQVTVLAGTLLPVVTPGDAVDPETLYTVHQRFFALVQREVQGYAGIMQHFVDNAFLAFFVAPVAQEDHAQRAVLAALRLRECLCHPDTALESGTGQGWTVCMGVHTGEVIVGPIGDNLPPITLAVDNTTQVAEQLWRLAEAGAIVLFAVTGRLVQDVIRLDRAGLVTVPGITASQRVYKVLGLLPYPGSFSCPASAGNSANFPGNAGLQPGSGSHAGAWRSQGQPGENRKLNGPVPYHPALQWQGRRMIRQFVGRECEMGTLHALLAQMVRWWASRESRG